jgi:hypothetical protein
MEFRVPNGSMFREIKSCIEMLIIMCLIKVRECGYSKYLGAWFQEFHTDFSAKYESAVAICASMKAAVRFLKNYDKLERELFELLDESLPSLPFHGNLDVVKHCIGMAVNKPHL